VKKIIAVVAMSVALSGVATPMANADSGRGHQNSSSSSSSSNKVNLGGELKKIVINIGKLFHQSPSVGHSGR